jgi:hypothetical protein
MFNSFWLSHYRGMLVMLPDGTIEERELRVHDTT